MKKRWFSLLLCLTLAVSLVLTGCSNATTDPGDSASPSADSSDDGGDAVTDTSTFTIGLAGEPPSFDPKDFNSTNAALTAYNVYDTLLDFGEDGETLEPCLAASWEMVDDVTYVYQIRDDITFSDGSALTIDDVVFSLDRIKDPDTAASMSYLFNSVESFEATGDYELTVHLAYPDATWKFVPATSPCTIISKSYYEAHAENYGTPDGTCLGTGPYMFESWASGSEIVLTKNENWWGDPSTQLWDEVVYEVIPDNTARALAATGGQVDYVHSLHTETLEVYDSADNLTVYSYPYTTSSFIAFNTQKAPFDDINVRKACAYALDKDTIAQTLGGRYATISKGVPFGPVMYYMDEEAWNEALDNEMEDYSYDMDLAQQYIAESGYPDGFTCDIYCLAGNTGLSEVVQYQLSLLGITVNIVEVTSSEMYEIGYGYKLDEDGQRLYDILATGWLSDYLDPIGYLVPFWASSSIYPGGANRASYSNAEVDALIDQIYAEPDDAARAALEIEAFTIAAEDCPYVTLYYYDQTYALNNDYTYTENAGFFWNFDLTDFKLAE